MCVVIAITNLNSFQSDYREKCENIKHSCTVGLFSLLLQNAYLSILESNKTEWIFQYNTVYTCCKTCFHFCWMLLWVAQKKTMGKAWNTNGMRIARNSKQLEKFTTTEHKCEVSSVLGLFCFHISSKARIWAGYTQYTLRDETSLGIVGGMNFCMLAWAMSCCKHGSMHAHSYSGFITVCMSSKQSKQNNLEHCWMYSIILYSEVPPNAAHESCWAW